MDIWCEVIDYTEDGAPQCGLSAVLLVHVHVVHGKEVVMALCNNHKDYYDNLYVSKRAFVTRLTTEEYQMLKIMKS